MSGQKIYSTLIGGALLTSLVFASGCSLINPHVTWERTEPKAETTVQDGIDYANRAIDEYKAAIGEQAILTSVMGLGLIPLSLAALGLGITETDGNAIIALGLTGAAAYGAGSWLGSKTRQLVYVAGMEGMTCAKDAMLPLNFSTNERDALDEDLESLKKAIGSLEDRIGNVKNLIKKVDELAPDATDLLEDAEGDVRTAETLLETGKSTWKSGTRLDLELSRAGQALVSAVDRIGALVDKAIVKTESNIQALPGMINDLAQISAQITKVPESPVSTEEIAGTSEDLETQFAAQQLKAQQKDLIPDEAFLAKRDLNNELDKLKNSAEALSNATRKVAAVVNSVSEAKPIETLKQCGVEDVTGIQVRPAGDVRFIKGQAGTRRLVVTGGKPSYFAQLLEEPVEGLTAESKPSAGVAFVVIEATNKVEAGEYHVYIVDTAGNDKTVTVRVEKSE